MIKVVSKNGAQYLDVSGQKIRRDKSGVFLVKRDTLLREDLSELPAGTLLVIDNYEYDKQSDDLVFVIGLNVLNPGDVKVFVNHHRQSDSWHHVLDYAKYYMIADSLLKSSSNKANLSEWRLTGFKDGLHHKFSFTVSNGTLEEIEREAIAVVTPILQPLLDFKEDLDKMCKSKFGI
jgi:hypothetical protein